MNLGDWLILGVCGLVGFGIVWGAFSLIRQQRAPPRPMFEPGPPPSNAPAISVAELGDRWHQILQVSPNVVASDLDRAYHDRLAECDRVRFSSDANAEEKLQAETRRAQINQAFEFARPLR